MRERYAGFGRRPREGVMGKRERGVLSHWNDGRGFGFIQPEGSAPEDALFVHVRAFP